MKTKTECNIFDIRNKYNDLILVFILCIVCIYAFILITSDTKNKKSTNNKIPTIGGIMVFILLYTIASKRICTKNLEMITYECLGVESDASNIITSENKYKATFSFLYYYILTFISTIIWGFVYFLIVFIVFCSFFSIYKRSKDNVPYIFTLDFNKQYKSLPKSVRIIWFLFKWISLCISAILLPLMITIVIPVSMVEPGINKFIDIFRIKDGIIKYFVIIFVASIFGTIIIIERFSYLIVGKGIKIFKRVFDNLKYTNFFDAFNPSKETFYHIPIFLIGFLIAFIFSFINLPIIKNLNDCSSEERSHFINRFIAGFFFITIMIILIYIVYLFTYLFSG